MCERQPLVALCPLQMRMQTESAVTTVSSSLFQSATVLTKNEFLYCSVLLSEILKPQELRISCLAMVLSESQSLKVVGHILLLFLSAVKSDKYCTQPQWSRGDEKVNEYIVACEPRWIIAFIAQP